MLPQPAASSVISRRGDVLWSSREKESAIQRDPRQRRAVSGREEARVARCRNNHRKSRSEIGEFLPFPAIPRDGIDRRSFGRLYYAFPARD